MLADLLPQRGHGPIHGAGGEADGDLAVVPDPRRDRIPVARWVNNITWMATLRPFLISSSTSRDSSATTALWALTSGEVPLRSWKNVCASSITTTTSGQDGEEPRCQASVTPAPGRWRPGGRP